MENQGEMVLAWGQAILLEVLANIGALFGPHSRLYFPYLLAAMGVVLFASLINRRRAPLHRPNDKADLRVGIAQLTTASSLVDLKVTLANRIFTPTLVVIATAATISSAQLVAEFLSGSPIAAPEADAPPSLAALVMVTIAITLASDLTTYFVHRLHHESLLLWPFHKLHHSAETLTPLTFFRKHPVYDLIRILSNAFILGPVQGVIFALFNITDVVTVLGVNALYAVFYWTGANLRHSQIWISYGPLFSRIFISPAQHQIHHSCAVIHHDKNYGEMFAIWDWMFGTLYVPKSFERLEFGVADETGRRIEQPHPTLKAAWLTPLQESATELRKDLPSPAKWTT